KEFSGEPTLVNCVSITHAKDAAEAFRVKGIAAEAIYGTMQEEEREAILGRFRSGETKVITSVNLLSEGFDEQKATVCFNLRPTMSVVLAAQRGGRVLRIDEDNPLKIATIVDFIDKEETGKSPITFAEIAGDSYIMPSDTTEDNR